MLAVTTGFIESAAGYLIGTGGVALSATGVGAIVGVPAAAVGGALAAHGSITVVTALHNLTKVEDNADAANNHKSRGGSSDDGSSDASGLTSWDKFKNNPPDHPDFTPPKNWNGKKVKNPNGKGAGYPDDKGNVWIPETHKGTHGAHWDVQLPRGKYRKVYPK